MVQQERVNQRWILDRRPAGRVAAGDLRLEKQPVPELMPGQILIRNVYLSLDPSSRIWMSDEDQYMPPVEIGNVMRGLVYGIVEASASDRIEAGKLVSPAFGGWETYTIAEAAMTRVIQPSAGEALSDYAGVLGPTGITAWLGLREIGHPAAGETVVVSAAAGAVGSVACQIAKFDGCRVIAITGSDEKCAWLRDEAGVDGTINYRSEPIGGRLDALCPDGIDLAFENVGGEIMNEVFARLNDFGRMVVCGLISSYNLDGPAPGPSDFGRVLMRRLTIRGFIASDFRKQFPTALEELGALVQSGRLKTRTHIVDGLETAPDALNMLYSGENRGKLLLRISPEEGANARHE
ncbi:NADP-dependent oxidoreductase [Henriciella mobilis]|uniref:NADP-dependent oxidoreductase n=1 Tax=Henriciella mobilis TaxID=2305467 RepID=A0A399RHA8_9PROT|nr:NADP-dependent oxidoreductase [Henriciella mobilis]RIJ29864.1 NADP-dependent oxidoreductase [Henriciella mobilis]